MGTFFLSLLQHPPGVLHCTLAPVYPEARSGTTSLQTVKSVDVMEQHGATLDSQEQVMSVRQHFAALGIPTWMDIDGGMQVDIFDSMAQGVTKAAVVVAFISQRYQDSENCKLVTRVTELCLTLSTLAKTQRM